MSSRALPFVLTFFVVFFVLLLLLLLLFLLLLLLLFSALFNIVITSLGEERVLVYIFPVHVFVYFARVNFYLLSLPLGVRGWLRLVIVALLGLFFELFVTCIDSDDSNNG